ncbi:hypothetical protein [Methyloversatilis discipulorum]|uniref:hypothetical protein n=1 Tax=Methyloversatilis discipulorum TaxID=1119528 RepID=UPI00036C07F1|nr:hypothetical protein [Methyloversatilis discipulorum]
MAVQNQTPVASFTTSGVTTAFPFAFMLLDADDLVVTLDGVTVSSGFSIAGIGAPAGGSAVFASPPSAGQLLVLRRNIALQRLNDYQRNGDLLAQVLNLDLDRIWQALQGLRQDATRALKLPDGTLTDQTIPDDAAARAGKLVGFDSSGNVAAVEVSTPGALLVSAFIETLLPSANAAAARSVFGAVGTSGADTIDGAKTFTSPLTIPDGTDPSHAASVGQIQDEEAARDVAIAAAIDPVTLAPTLLVRGTITATSGASLDALSAVPSWATEIIISFHGVSTNGTSPITVRAAVGGAAVSSGYQGSVNEPGTATVNLSSGFQIGNNNTAAAVWHGVLRLVRGEANRWAATSGLGRSDTAAFRSMAGSVALSGTLTGFSITTNGGADNFDAGVVDWVAR